MSATITREVEMFPIVRDWLASRGLEVRAEVSVMGGPVDAVGFTDSKIVAVEMKLAWQRTLLAKLRHDLSYWADEVWFCHPGTPRQAVLDSLSREGIGVLSCQRGVILDSRQLGQRFISRWRERAFEKLLRAPEGVVGGAPTTKGQGPRQLCEQRVREYMRQHPQAKSREVFDSVANHYATFQSFSGVFGAFIRSIRRGEVTP